MHILFIGYGKTSQRVAKQLFDNDHQITTVSLSKKSDSIAQHLQQDAHSLDLNHIQNIDCVYVLLSPTENSIKGYQNTYVDTAYAILKALKSHSIQRLIVVSSTRVYSQIKVDDDTQVIPHDEQGKILQNMESIYQNAYPNHCVIVRPTGIYGTSIERMKKLAFNTNIYTKCHWSNRIHIDDLSYFLAQLSSQKNPHSSYIVTDSKPYPLHEIIMWFQQELGLPILDYQPQETTGKQVFATRLHAKLQYPDCFESYRQLLTTS